MRTNKEKTHRKWIGWIVLTVLLLLILAAAVVTALHLEGVISLPLPAKPTAATEATVPTEPSTAPTTVPTEPTEPPAPLPLVIAPQNKGGDTQEDTARFTGSADPAGTLTVNGTPVTVAQDGSFACDVALELGENEIVFQYSAGEKAETQSFALRRYYALAAFSPRKTRDVGSDALVIFEAVVRKDSEASVEFCGETVALTKTDNQLGTGIPEGFEIRTGTYALNHQGAEAKNLGPAVFTVTCGDNTETAQSGDLTCLPTAEVRPSDPEVTPDYGDYVDVGSGYICEIVTYSAETFDGDTKDDFSHPTNNYLPKGTLDYCAAEPVGKGNLSYRLLRFGRRVYITKRNYPNAKRTTVVNCYKGTLPDHNELAVASFGVEGHHTVLTLNTLWKAPFLVQLQDQEYKNPDGGSGRDYSLTAFTAEYVDLTFCYATVFEGELSIPEENPLFRSAEVISNEADTVLRLYFKNPGAFYGWDCEYNEEGQLCFYFLNPVTVTAAENTCGADLTGVTVMVDVGHGGADGGAVGEDAQGNAQAEAKLNLLLAKALKAKLESAGATVILNRDSEISLKVDERIQMLKTLKPDLCVAIHQNSAEKGQDLSGFEGSYFHPFAKGAMDTIFARTKEAGIYRYSRELWFNYYVARQTVCPVVLTENGYLSDAKDLANALSSAGIEKKAQAIAQGIGDYFLQIG